MAKPRVSACIVTYQCYEKCREAVASLLQFSTGVDLTLYIVDNHSGDGGLDLLTKEFPAIVPLQLPDNKGFGHGHNAVIPLLESDYHAVINPDILIDRDVLADLAAFLDRNEDTVLVTPKILFPDGRDQQLPKRDPVVFSLVGRHIFKRRLADTVRHYQMLDEDVSKPLDIEFSTGCFFMMRTDVFKRLGGFDERWFMYYEDMDITRRARQIGRTIYNPDTYVYHAWERLSSHNPRFFLILVHGMFKYFGKWGWKFRY